MNILHHFIGDRVLKVRPKLKRHKARDLVTWAKYGSNFNLGFWPIFSLWLVL